MPAPVGYQLSPAFKAHIKYHTLEGYTWYCNLSEEEREKERNRFAAKKYRAQKKNRKNILEGHLANLEKKTAELKSENLALKNQLANLEFVQDIDTCFN